MQSPEKNAWTYPVGADRDSRVYAVLGGGLPGGDMLFVVGEPGIGKTILALQMAFARVRGGGHALLLTTFSEGHDKLISHLAGFEFSISRDRPAIAAAKYFADACRGVDATTRSIARTIRQQSTNLVIIDGFRGIRDAFPSDYATRQFLQVLGTQMAYLGTTLVRQSKLISLLVCCTQS